MKGPECLFSFGDGVSFGGESGDGVGGYGGVGGGGVGGGGVRLWVACRRTIFVEFWVSRLGEVWNEIQMKFSGTGFAIRALFDV